MIKTSNTAYIIGVAIGDGNLSNSNGRAVRLRITCDNKYPSLMNRITHSLQVLLPENKVSTYLRTENCTDVYCYSNQLEKILGWKALGGSKFSQRVRIPLWIFEDDIYMKNCLRGLFETDGSVYWDRSYFYANFTTIIPQLAEDVIKMIKLIGYSPSIQTSIPKHGKQKYVIRICKKSLDFIKDIHIEKI